jgi:hypothetical protein
MDFSRSNIEPQGKVVESAGADPAHVILDRVQRGEEAVSLAFGVIVESRSRVRGLPLAALPA